MDIKMDKCVDLWESIADEVRSIIVLGAIRTGKTSLVYHILSHMKRPVFVYKHPKPELIEALGYHQMYGLGEVESMQDCVIWIDEPDVYFPAYDKQVNHTLIKLLSLCGQRGITLIISTSNDRFVQKSIEAYVECWCLKNLDFRSLKNGSQPKRIVLDNVYLNIDGFALSNNEYLLYCPRFKQFNGRRSFKPVEFFTDEYSKPYRL
ncbi:MAG: AAA family ATPase [Candidatus Nanoarchaeia archaeon]|jgi:hypothetical protein